jgi:hypothetical protein
LSDKNWLDGFPSDLSNKGSLAGSFQIKIHLARRRIMVLVSKQYLSTDKQDAGQKYPTDDRPLQGFGHQRSDLGPQ